MAEVVEEPEVDRAETPAGRGAAAAPAGGPSGKVRDSPQIIAAIVGGASSTQPAVIGTTIRFARSLTNARGAPAVEGQVSEEARDEEEQAHAEDVDDVERRRPSVALCEMSRAGMTRKNDIVACSTMPSSSAKARAASRAGSGSGVASV